MAKITKDQNIADNYNKARFHFKRAEPVIAFVDKDNYLTLNGPNLLKIEEEDYTNIRIQQPQGFQVMEELIFAESDSIDKEVIKQKARFIEARLKLIAQNTDLSKYKNYHFLWLVRDAIIRVSTTSLTGFDSPNLASLDEAQIVYNSIANYLSYFQNEFKDVALHNQWQKEIDKTLTDLKGDFESFDRYSFIKEHTNKQLDLWVRTVEDWSIIFPFDMAINNEAQSLFDRNTFNVEYFAGRHSVNINEQTVALGEQLFYDKNLSKDKSMSCGSCHQPEKAFTDGQKTSIGNNGNPLKRNSPTLTYAAFQKGFFYDKRAGNLEGQISGVVSNENEFHTNLEILEEEVRANDKYRMQFAKHFKDTITESNIRNAIATYIRSLASFSSKFDKNIRGEEESLSEQEVLGFNLFMGKAACGTCHFAPLFNGTVPPNFKESELEALGVPATAKNQRLDDDLGRFELFKTSERKHLFKTPTIRNITKTAPYMHNGVYDSLEQVMHFYNVGGGLGLGFNIDNQTLPPDSLNLQESEIEAIIAFLHTLTDEEPY
ncbi:cytochrome-c peroxidase [Fulvivirga aurantia]|uniref:cytochrome-c peroxidase n=1 Tax=Fulvivirga aurantia TaxID=2529383 RepID=UPI001FEC7CF2|nr:cytochrome c peroxidase [Fulvivirga aurantia]